VRSRLTGRQLTIADGDYRAVVTAVGATLRTLRHRDEDLVDGFGADEVPEAGHGQILAPWPNRLRDGAWSWAGERLLLPVDEPTKGNSASHGLVRRLTWTVIAHDCRRLRMHCVLNPQPGYPFRLDLIADYRVDEIDGLSASITARNIGTRAAPVALGAHPYLRPPGGGLIDHSMVRVPAATRMLPDARGIPYGRESVAGTDFDLRTLRRVGALAVNDAFCDLERDMDGRVQVQLTGSDGRCVVLTAGPSCRWLQVYTGDGLTPARRRRSMAIEPMTAPAGALESGLGITVLAPGESMTLDWSISVAPGEPTKLPRLRRANLPTPSAPRG